MVHFLKFAYRYEKRKVWQNNEYSVNCWKEGKSNASTYSASKAGVIAILSLWERNWQNLIFL